MIIRKKRQWFPPSMDKKLRIQYNRDSMIAPEVFKNIKTSDAAKMILRKRNSRNIKRATYEGSPI